MRPKVWPFPGLWAGEGVWMGQRGFAPVGYVVTGQDPHRRGQAEPGKSWWEAHGGGHHPRTGPQPAAPRPDASSGSRRGGCREFLLSFPSCFRGPPAPRASAGGARSWRKARGDCFASHSVWCFPLLQKQASKCLPVPVPGRIKGGRGLSLGAGRLRVSGAVGTRNTAPPGGTAPHSRPSIRRLPGASKTHTPWQGPCGVHAGWAAASWASRRSLRLPGRRELGDAGAGGGHQEAACGRGRRCPAAQLCHSQLGQERLPPSLSFLNCKRGPLPGPTTGAPWGEMALRGPGFRG